MRTKAGGAVGGGGRGRYFNLGPKVAPTFNPVPRTRFGVPGMQQEEVNIGMNVSVNNPGKSPNIIPLSEIGLSAAATPELEKGLSANSGGADDTPMSCASSAASRERELAQAGPNLTFAVRGLSKENSATSSKGKTPSRKGHSSAGGSSPRQIGVGPDGLDEDGDEPLGAGGPTTSNASWASQMTTQSQAQSCVSAGGRSNVSGSDSEVEYVEGQVYMTYMLAGGKR